MSCAPRWCARLHRPNTGVVAAAQWARAAPGLAATARRYLKQISVSLHPSTVRDTERSLRELGVLPNRACPRGRRGGRHHPRPHRGVQVLARPPSPTWRRHAAPVTPSAPADHPALLLRAGRRVGLRRRPHPSADLRRRPAHPRPASAPLPRRRRVHQAAPRGPRRSRPLRHPGRGAARPHRAAPGRASWR